MRMQVGLLTFLLLIGKSVFAYTPDVFDTNRSVSAQASYDVGRVDLPCGNGVPDDELYLEEAIEQILCHNPQVSLAWSNAKAQAAQVGISKAAYLPRLDGRISATRSNNNLDYNNEALPSGSNHRRLLSSGIELSWELFDFGRRHAALRKDQQLLIAANASHDAALQRVFSAAAADYYEALSAQRSLAASRQVARLAAQNLEAADAKYKAGAAALSDRLQAQTVLSQARLTQVRDEGALDNALGVIAIQMGLPPDTRLRLHDEMSANADINFVKDIEKLLADALHDNPTLLAAQARLKAADAAVDERRAAGRPTLSLTANLAHNSTRQAQAFSGDFREHDRSIGLQLSIPLFEGFRRNYQIRNALARRDATESELAEVAEQVSMDVWRNYQSLTMETRSLTRTRELVEQSRQSLEVVTGRYKSGVGSMLEMLNALSAYSNATNQDISALSKWQTSRLRLAESLGRLGFWVFSTRER